MSQFGIELSNCLIKKKTSFYHGRYNCAENLFCRYCSAVSCGVFVAAVQRKDFSIVPFHLSITVDGE